MSFARTALCMVAAAVACAGEAPAQLVPEPPTRQVVKPAQVNAVRVASPTESRDAAWVEARVKAMGSDDLATRDGASRELATDPGVTLAQLEARLADKSRPLSPEQSLRLSEAGLQRFSLTPRAAMGVSFAVLDTAGDGVKVGAAVDGFDSRRVLRPGDVIREMDGVTITGGDQLEARNQMIALIVSHDPGDQVTLALTRGGEPVTVRLTLGNYGDLGRNANELDAMRLRAAWGLRCRRMASAQADDSEVVEAGISAQRWSQISDPMVRIAQRQAQQIRQANPFLPRQAPEPDSTDEGATLVAAGSDRTLESAPPTDYTAGRLGQINGAEAMRIQQQIQYFDLMLEREQKRLQDGNINENLRRVYEANIANYRKTIDQLRSRKRQLMGLDP